MSGMNIRKWFNFGKTSDAIDMRGAKCFFLHVQTYIYNKAYKTSKDIPRANNSVFINGVYLSLVFLLIISLSDDPKNVCKTTAF